MNIVRDGIPPSCLDYLFNGEREKRDLFSQFNVAVSQISHAVWLNLCFYQADEIHSSLQTHTGSTGRIMLNLSEDTDNRMHAFYLLVDLTIWKGAEALWVECLKF